MYSKKFWLNTLERVVTTMAQVAAGGFGVSQIPVPAFEVDWRYTAGVTMSAGILSFLKCLGSRKVGNPEDGSVLP